MLRSRLFTVARRSFITQNAPIATRLTPALTVRQPTSFIRSYSSTPELTRDIIKERILEIFESFDKVKNPAEIQESSNLQKDLGLDSLDLVDIIMALEEEFSIEIPEQDAPGIRTVADTIKYIENTPDAV